MRFKIDFAIDGEYFPKDKNRVFLSLLKFVTSKTDPDLFEQIYNQRDLGYAYRKNFAFSYFFENVDFLKDYIIIPERRFSIFFTVPDLHRIQNIGHRLFSCFQHFINHTIRYKEFQLNITHVRKIEEKSIASEKVIFKSMSPIVIREHDPETNRDYFYSFTESLAEKEFLENLKIQLREQFTDKDEKIQNIRFKILRTKEVKVKHYDIVINSNLCEIEFYADRDLLKYMYQAGIGSYSSAGFGMLEIKQ